MINTDYSIKLIKQYINDSGQSSATKSEEYLAALKSVYGAEKVNEVCSRYHIFQKPQDHLKPLNINNVRKLQVGLNDISASDLDAFLAKIKSGATLSEREAAALDNIGMNGAQELIRYAKASTLPAALFNSLMAALREPNESYRDTTFTHPRDPFSISGIPGRLFSKQHFMYGFFSFKKGRSLEDEERMRLYNEIEALDSTQLPLYCELLTKIIVKKHLYYETKGSKELRMEMLVPAPRGPDGQPRWYRVEDMLDSGLGKFAYRLVPATNEYAADMPDLLLYRNSAPLPTAMDSFTSFLSDFNIYPPGYFSKNACKQQEMSWLKTSTPSPGNMSRPLVITGHSLGSSNAQLALLNMQESGSWPNRAIALQLFDSPAILQSDAARFAEWIHKQKIETELKFDYYVSDGDPVPLAGSLAGSTYLGNNLDPDQYAVTVHKQQLSDEGMKQIALTGKGPHGRIFHRGIPDVDFTDTKVTVSQYDQEVLRQRITVNSLRIFSAAIVWSTMAPIGGMKRFFLGRRHHDPIIVQLFQQAKDNLKIQSQEYFTLQTT